MCDFDFSAWNSRFSACTGARWSPVQSFVWEHCSFSARPKSQPYGHGGCDTRPEWPCSMIAIPRLLGSQPRLLGIHQYKHFCTSYIAIQGITVCWLQWEVAGGWGYRSPSGESFRFLRTVYGYALWHCLVRLGWISLGPSLFFLFVSPSESKWVRMSPSESKWNAVRRSKSKWVWSESTWIRVNPNEFKWIQVNPSETKRGQVNPRDTPPSPLRQPPIQL